MEHQKIIILLDIITNQPSKFSTKNWTEINDQSRGTYNTNSDIMFKSTMLSLVHVIIVMHTYFLNEK